MLEIRVERAAEPRWVAREKAFLYMGGGGGGDGAQTWVEKETRAIVYPP